VRSYAALQPLGYSVGHAVVARSPIAHAVDRLAQLARQFRARPAEGVQRGGVLGGGHARLIGGCGTIRLIVVFPVSAVGGGLQLRIWLIWPRRLSQMETWMPMPSMSRPR